MCSLERFQDWRGTAIDLAALLREVLTDILPGDALPSVRTIRYWRSYGVIGHSGGRNYAEREALETLTTVILQREGFKLDIIQERLKRLSLQELRTFLQKKFEESYEPQTIRPNFPSKRAQSIIFMLAIGIVQLYKIISSNEQIVRQEHEAIPEELQNALSHLGRLYLEEGKEDQAASIHEILYCCHKPLNTWGLQAFTARDFPFADSVLIDPDLFVPTIDCLDVARTRGGGTANILEEEAYQTLIKATQLTESDAHRVYTATRKYLGRHSLTTLGHMLEYCNKHILSDSIISLLTNDFYMQVPDAWLVHGKALKCAHCGTLLRPDSTDPSGIRCPLIACRDLHSKRTIGEHLEASQARVVKPYILSYWVNPAIDELYLYDAAKEAGLPVRLYPNSDQCDVSLNDTIGIDVKSQRNPITLGKYLNESIGGLSYFERRVLAIPDGVILRRRHYLSLMREELETTAAKSLEVMPVSRVLRLIKEVAHA